MKCEFKRSSRLTPTRFVLGKLAEFQKTLENDSDCEPDEYGNTFCFFAFSAVYIGAGLLSIINATVPIFSACVAYVVYKERLSRSSSLGLLIGFLGVVVLMFNPGESFGSSGWLAILSALLACLLYGTAINLTVNNLQGVSGLTITAEDFSYQV